MTSDSELADTIIDRLNIIIQDPSIREDVEKLIGMRVRASSASAAHPSIQVQKNDSGDNVLGFLGLLNGIVGMIPDGRLKGLGYVAAVFDSEGKLERFRRTDYPNCAVPRVGD